MSIATLTLQQWGNSLAVRIPSKIAKSAHFSVGQPVTLNLLEHGIAVIPQGDPKLTLSQKLAAFDRSKHSGEAMLTSRLGKEEM